MTPSEAALQHRTAVRELMVTLGEAMAEPTVDDIWTNPDGYRVAGDGDALQEMITSLQVTNAILREQANVLRVVVKRLGAALQTIRAAIDEQEDSE